MRWRLCSRGVLAVAGALALMLVHADRNEVVRAHPDAWERVQVIFNPEVAAGAAQAQNKPVPRAQDGHQWDGLAVFIDPLETTRIYDVHEFDVLPNFDNDVMQIKVPWESGPAVAYDLDLYLERQVGGQWNPVAQSTNGQSLGEGSPEESVTLVAPAPGKYRTRVHNWASHQIAYHGAASFTSDGVITKERKVRIAGGRATEGRPDVASGLAGPRHLLRAGRRR